MESEQQLKQEQKSAYSLLEQYASEMRSMLFSLKHVARQLGIFSKLSTRQYDEFTRDVQPTQQLEKVRDLQQILAGKTLTINEELRFSQLRIELFRLESALQDCRDIINQKYLQSQTAIVQGFRYVRKADAVSVRATESQLVTLRSAATVGAVFEVMTELERLGWEFPGAVVSARTVDGDGLLRLSSEKPASVQTECSQFVTGCINQTVTGYQHELPFRHLMSDWVRTYFKKIQSVLIEHYAAVNSISGTVFASETNRELLTVLESQIVVPDDAGLQKGTPFLETKEMLQRLGPTFSKLREEIIAEVLEAQQILSRIQYADSTENILQHILLLTPKFKIQETAFKNYVNGLQPHELLLKVSRIELFGNRKDDAFGVLYEKYVSVPKKERSLNEHAKLLKSY